MVETAIKAVVGISFIVGAWLSVQLAWNRIFASSLGEDPDPMIDRCGGCHQCLMKHNSGAGD